jgi:leader peptidase (prepilin peptidase) / N-methyltransferase
MTLRQPFAYGNLAAILIFGLVGVAAAVASLLAAPGLNGTMGAALAVIMAAIAFYDARYLIIPNALTVAAFVLALVYAALGAPNGAAFQAGSVAILRATAAALTFFAIKFAYEKLRGHPGLGMGDVKLMGVAGAWLAWLTILYVVEIAVVATLVAYMLRQRSKSRPLRATGVVPFGLFLAPAIWLGWLLDVTYLAG